MFGKKEPEIQKEPAKKKEESFDLSAIANRTRSEMLKLFSKKDLLTFTDFLKNLELDTSQTGKLGYHLKILKQANIIVENSNGGYSLTDIGKKVLDFIWELEDLTHHDTTEIYVRTSSGKYEKFDRNKIKNSL